MGDFPTNSRRDVLVVRSAAALTAVPELGMYGTSKRGPAGSTASAMIDPCRFPSASWQLRFPSRSTPS
jgi:hypothetical protein